MIGAGWIAGGRSEFNLSDAAVCANVGLRALKCSLFGRLLVELIVILEMQLIEYFVMLTKLGLKKQTPHLSTLLTATLTLLIAGESAVACSVMQSGAMPICGGLTIAPETDVIIIESYDTGGLTNVLLGSGPINWLDAALLL